ncbi:MAG: hypothetical protein L6R28_00875 [Planctomycetes bacterium]|nr:hypothetical protein [Planctomycetota bacterium]
MGVRINTTNAVEYFRGYLEGYLTADEKAHLEAHLEAHPEDREALKQFAQMHGMMDELLGSRKISPDFDQRSTRRLMERREAMKTGSYTSQDLSSSALGVNGVDADFEEEEVVAASSGGFLDSLSAQFGAAPWWIISGAFHALLILLVFLIGMVVMQAKQQDMVIVTNLEKQEKPPEPEKKLEREVVEKPTPIVESEVVTDQQPIVTHEVVEFAEQVETDNDSDAHDSKGQDGISDIWLGGQGTVGSIGVGGGGRAGAFGRPGGAGGRLRRAVGGGGGKATESAVDKALEWLARHQEADGSWKVTATEGDQANWDPGVTGLAVLAFLGAGHTEKIGKYKGNVQKGIAWIIAQQAADGSIGNQAQWKNHGGCGYHHPICGMALAEAAAMARIPETAAAAQKAINYSCEIHQAQDGPSDKFGWRYTAKDRTGDLSNVGWFVMQLKSAKVAGLQVDPASFEGAIKYLNHVMADPVNVKKDPNASYDTGGHRYGYSDKNPWHNTTSIGTLCRLFTGTKPEEVAGAVRWVMNEEPLRWEAGMGKGVSNHPFPMYFLYYTTLTAFQVGGEIWKEWNDGMKQLLLTNQRKDGDADGSWDPLGGHEKKAGRAYTTALGAMCLEVYYRYLPMYRE